MVEIKLEKVEFEFCRDDGKMMRRMLGRGCWLCGSELKADGDMKVMCVECESTAEWMPVDPPVRVRQDLLTVGTL